MNRSWQMMCVGAAGSVLALLAACATDGPDATDLEDDTSSPVPSPEVDASVDAPNEDAAACEDDCELYPDECTEDALCASVLFGPSSTPDTLDIRTQVQSLAARSATDAWLVGTSGAAAHFDGVTWRRSVTDTQYSLNAIWLRSDGEVAFQTPRALFTRGLDVDAGAPSAGGWSLFGAAAVSDWSQFWDIQVYASWAHPASDSLWIGTRDERGGLWRLRRRPDGGFSFASASLDKCRLVPCGEVTGMDGLSPDVIWAVGLQGAAFRVTDAESDNPVFEGFLTDTPLALLDVWMAGENDVWAVGATGTVRRWRGDPHTFEAYDEVPTKKHLRAIAGSSPNDIWIAGDDATVYHYDGAAWTRMKVAGLGGRRPSLEHIWVPSPGKVWIAGHGVLLSLGGKS